MMSVSVNSRAGNIHMAKKKSCLNAGYLPGVDLVPSVLGIGTVPPRPWAIVIQHAYREGIGKLGI